MTEPEGVWRWFFDKSEIIWVSPITQKGDDICWASCELRQPEHVPNRPYFAGECERRAQIRVERRSKQSNWQLLKIRTHFCTRLARSRRSPTSHVRDFGCILISSASWFECHQLQVREWSGWRTAVLDDPAKRGWYFARFGRLSSCHTQSTSMAFWVMGDTHIISLLLKNHLPTPSGSVINRHSLFYCRILYLA